MKEFNFEDFKKGKSAYTRQGHKAVFIKLDLRDSVYPICACVDGEMMYMWFTINGISANCQSFDLHM